MPPGYTLIFYIPLNKKCVNPEPSGLTHIMPLDLHSIPQVRGKKQVDIFVEKGDFPDGQTGKCDNVTEKQTSAIRIVKKPTPWVDFLIWSEQGDSNPRPLGPEPSAIPSFAMPR